MGTATVEHVVRLRKYEQRHGRPLLEVNLEQNRRLENVFATFDVRTILLELEAAGGKSPSPDCIIFLDEIQATPSAIAALRYLYEEREDLTIVAAGSLLETVLGKANLSMPVGRIEYLHLGPLTFSESLRALGDEDLLGLCGRWTPGEPWPDSAHRRLAARQREFLIVGGMPEAVAAYASGESVEQVRRIHRSIASTYRDDFAKYDSKASSIARLQTVFDYIPAALGRKTKYANISRKTSPASSVRPSISWPWRA
jgi:hypothetical protein